MSTTDERKFSLAGLLYTMCVTCTRVKEGVISSNIEADRPLFQGGAGRHSLCMRGRALIMYARGSTHYVCEGEHSLCMRGGVGCESEDSTVTLHDHNGFCYHTSYIHGQFIRHK